MDDVLPPVATSAIELSFELIATVLQSAESMPLARVQEVVFIPGQPDLLIALDTRGVVWLFEDGILRDTPLLDLRSAGIGFTEAGPESGLRSIAFHPDFSNPGTDGYGKIYIAYSASVASLPGTTLLFEADGFSPVFHDVISEFTIADPTNPVIDPAGERELFRVEQPFGNHNFGQMRFRPGATPADDDYGHLYLGIGDGGAGNDPLDAAENLGEIFGKILRIDPIEAENGDPYSTPGDNPFVSTGGALPEIYAFGFRNPQSLSWQGDLLFSGDIGQNAVEELNVVLAGGNYGWDDREGTFLAGGDPLPGNDADLGYQYPLTQYDHEEISSGGEAIFGGFAYQGSDIPALQGFILFSNFPTGEVFVADLFSLNTILADGLVGSDESIAPLRVTIIGADGEETTFADVTGNASGRVDLRFTETASGEILAFSKQTGHIYRLTSAANDQLIGDVDPEEIRGGVGADTVEGLAGDDTLFGGSGHDEVTGGDGADLIFGGDGDDLLIGDNQTVATANQTDEPIIAFQEEFSMRLAGIKMAPPPTAIFDPIIDDLLVY